MKKVLIALALLLPMVLLIAGTQPTTVAVPTNGGHVTIMAMPDDQELIEDEADPSGNWSVGPYKVGHKFAVKLTPKSYPFDIMTAKYAPIKWALPADTNWQVPGDMVFFSVGTDGYPDTELGRKTVTPTQVGGWDEHDVSELNITISSGSFFFAIERINEQPLDKASYPATCSDFAKPLHHVSWAFTTFSNPDSTWDGWLPFDEFGFSNPDWPDDMSAGDSIDLMLRVIGDAPTIGIVELGSEGVISVSSKLIVSSGTIDYTLPQAGAIEISLWDAAGRHVETLYTGHSDAGEHTIAWDASNLASGTYFIRLNALNTVRVAKLVLVN